VRRWAIAVGDVVGKGLPAALLTAKLSAEIRLFLQGETDPARVVTRLNDQLCENGVLDMYITFLLAMLDITNHRLQIVNAGHPCPLIRGMTTASSSSARSNPGCLWRSREAGRTKPPRPASNRATWSSFTPTG
jgi:serine phosphatase RsbU (regulator of sigma subunit)